MIHAPHTGRISLNININTNINNSTNSAVVRWGMTVHFSDSTTAQQTTMFPAVLVDSVFLFRAVAAAARVCVGTAILFRQRPDGRLAFRGSRLTDAVD
mgnify:CR=1 FL=1